MTDQVVAPAVASTSETKLPFTELGVAINSSSSHSGLDINGLTSEQARDKVRQISPCLLYYP